MNPACIDFPANSYCYEDAVIDSVITAGAFQANQIAGSCPNGYKFLGGANVVGPNIVYVDDATTTNYLCPAGQYCDNESGLSAV